MIHQRFTTAILEAYADAPEIEAHVEAAGAARRWLDALRIDPKLRASLVEPIAAVEQAFATLANRRR